MPPETVECPRCGAGIGQPCVTPRNQRRTPHQARARAATPDDTKPDWYSDYVKFAEQPAEPIRPLPDLPRRLTFYDRMMAALPPFLHLRWYECAYQPVGRHHPSCWEGVDEQDECQYIILRPEAAPRYILHIEYSGSDMSTVWTSMRDAQTAAQWDWAYGRYADVAAHEDEVRSIWSSAIARNMYYAPDWEQLMRDRGTTLGSYDQSQYPAPASGPQPEPPGAPQSTYRYPVQEPESESGLTREELERQASLYMIDADFAGRDGDEEAQGVAMAELEKIGRELLRRSEVSPDIPPASAERAIARARRAGGDYQRARGL